MKFPIQLKQTRDGEWQARYIGGQVESLLVKDSLRDRALARMKENIRYHLEWCP
jgi:hypothetical protein